MKSNVGLRFGWLSINRSSTIDSKRQIVEFKCNSYDLIIQIFLWGSIRCQLAIGLVVALGTEPLENLKRVRCDDSSPNRAWDPKRLVLLVCLGGCDEFRRLYLEVRSGYDSV